MNHGKLEIVKPKMEHLNIPVLDVRELKWTGMGYFQAGNYKLFYSGNDKVRKMEWL